MIKTVQQIPEGWKYRAFGGIVDLVNGRGFKSSEWAKSGLPIIRIQNLNGSQDHNYYDNKYENKHLIDNGDLLFAWSGSRGTSFGPTIWRNKKGLLNQHIFKVVVGSDVDLKFLFYSLLKLTSFIEEEAHGSAGLVHVTKKELEKIKFLLPTKMEQKRIATILSIADEEIEKVEQIIEQTEKLKEGLMQKLLTKGIGHKSFKKTELGEIPEEWEVEKLSKVLRFENGKGHEKAIVEEGRYIVVNSKFISTNGKVIKFSNSNLKPLSKGDITMVMSDIPNGKALGKCFFILKDGKYTLNQRICSLRPLEGISGFYFYVLNRNKYFLSFNNGVGQTNLRKNEVLECPVITLSIAEQKKIVKILESVDKKLSINLKIKHHLFKLKKGLMKDLLSGKVLTN